MTGDAPDGRLAPLGRMGTPSAGSRGWSPSRGKTSLMTGDLPDGRGLSGCDDLVAGDRIAGSRSHQEDDFGVTGFGGRDPDGCDLLMVLADGMGGHRGGAEASRLAVSAFVETFRRAAGGVVARLRAALDEANAAVGRRAAETRYTHMGCTLVASAVAGDGAAHWISVGDSPLWRLRAGDGGMDRLNADHSMRPVLEGWVRTGRLSADEVDEGSFHQLRSALTGEELHLVDEGAPPVRLGIGDRLVLASDGLETLSDDEIRRLGGGNLTAAAIVSNLLAAVEAAGARAQDNATAVVYRHLGAAAVRGRFERLTADTRPMARRS